MDTPWLKYYAAFIPNLLACALFGIGMSVLWSPVPAAILYVPLIVGMLLFLGFVDRRRRRLSSSPNAERTTSEELAEWQRFRAERRRERPWHAVFGVFLVAATLGFLGVRLGTVLLATGFGVWLVDLLLVAPWLQADLELRMRSKLT